MSMNDALKTVISNETAVELPLCDNFEKQVHDYLEQNNLSFFNDKNSKPIINYIPYSISNKKECFYVIVTYNITEWGGINRSL